MRSLLNDNDVVVTETRFITASECEVAGETTAKHICDRITCSYITLTRFQLLIFLLL